MLKYPKSAISTTNMYNQALNIISRESIQTTNNLIVILQELIEPPPLLYIKNAIEHLMALELITEEKITPLGTMIARTGFDPMGALTLMMGYSIGCFEEVAIILSLIEKSNKMIGGIIREPKPGKDREFYNEQKRKYDKVRKMFTHRYGDHLSLLKIFTLFMKSENGKEFAKNHFLRFGILKDTKSRYKRIMHDSHQIFRHSLGGIKSVDLSREDKIILCFTFGYRLNLGKKMRKGYSTGKVDHVSVNKDSFLTGDANEVVYEELFKQSGRFNLNIVSAIPRDVKRFIKNSDVKKL